MIEDHNKITNFVLNFYQKLLFPSLMTEDIQETYDDYPLQKEMFDDSNIKKISAASLEALAKGSPDAKYIVIVCEFYFGPCVDKFYQIDEFLKS